MAIVSILKQSFKRIVYGYVSNDKIWKYRVNSINPKLSPLMRKYNGVQLERILKRYNAGIGSKAVIKGQPNFPHGVNGIFISSAAVIGSGCTILHQVTIGSNTIRDSKGFGAPVIGDNVYIGCGAKIIGNVHVGNNVLIGANCVITQNIPDNCTVVMPRPRVIEHEGKRDIEILKISAFTEKQEELNKE